MDYFYDGAIRRYILQTMRVFSDIKVESLPNSNGITTQSRVPIVYGDPSWQAAQILKGQNENALIPSPIFSLWLNNIEMAPERRQDPAFEGRINSVERQFNHATQSYTSEVGNRYTIERYMPVPYNITFQLDLWTTNTTTKLQILEQIWTLFNPSVQLQQNQNIFDWSSIFEVELINITWTNRAIGNQSDIERDVASMQFKVPVWINAPAKVKRINMIEQIVTNIYTNTGISDIDIDKSLLDQLQCSNTPLSRVITTPGNFKISIGINGYADNEIVLLNEYGVNDPQLSWKQLFTTYGNINISSKLLVLKLNSDIENNSNDIIGAISFDATRSNVLIFDIDIDTLPSSIASGPVLDIIDPTKSFPGSNLPTASVGHRYLLYSNSANDNTALIPMSSNWGNLIAYNNDIIEFNGNEWFVSFNSLVELEDQYVVNLNSLNHYHFINKSWKFTYFGVYSPGYWRLEGTNE